MVYTKKILLYIFCLTEGNEKGQNNNIFYEEWVGEMRASRYQQGILQSR